MEGDFVRSETMAFKVHFYPRPHMEGDRWQQQTRTQAGISTHALTWRATFRKASEIFRLLISTHALTWRATLNRYIPPRPGRDNISTHALTWRATHLDMIYDAIEEFLPTPSHGGRRVLSKNQTK